MYVYVYPSACSHTATVQHAAVDFSHPVAGCNHPIQLDTNNCQQWWALQCKGEHVESKIWNYWYIDLHHHCCPPKIAPWPMNSQPCCKLTRSPVSLKFAPCKMSSVSPTMYPCLPPAWREILARGPRYIKWSWSDRAVTMMTKTPRMIPHRGIVQSHRFCNVRPAFVPMFNSNHVQHIAKDTRIMPMRITQLGKNKPTAVFHVLCFSQLHVCFRHRNRLSRRTSTNSEVIKADFQHK